MRVEEESTVADMPSYTLAQLAEWVGGSLQGDPNLLITRVATLSQATSTKEGGDITFLSNPRYRRFLSETNAAAVILTEEDKALCPVASVIVKDPYLAYAKIATHFLPEALITPGIHPTASIAPSAEIHPTASIDAYVSVGANSRIGAHTRLHPHVVIGEDCVIGEECEIHPNTTFYNNVHLGAHGIIHSGCVIGADGFGFARHNKTWVKVPQLGRVYIGNDVEIGANTTIDRGALDDTVIEDGVKLDNQIQVGHGVRIGAHTAIAGCTGIAGSTHIGKYCMIGGASSINGHIQITDNVVVTAASAVTHAITEPGIYSSGMMLQENRKWRKNIIRFSQLDELARRIKQLEKEIQHFKGITETSYE